MRGRWQERGWILVAAIAIAAILAALLIPAAHSNGTAVWLATLPLLLVGVISPLSLLSPLAYMYLGRRPDAPALPASFQRPPPFRLA